MAYSTSSTTALSTVTTTITSIHDTFAYPIGATTASTSTYTYTNERNYDSITEEYRTVLEVRMWVTLTENVEATCQNMMRLGLPLQPNPDVSGLGVILAFVISAYLVQCWSIFAYFWGLLPPSLLRPVDLRIMKANSRHVDSQWHEALEKAAIIFSDQQIITGIGILLAGYCNIGSNLSAYHWQIITYLAWMSSNVHLTTLTLLREWLQINKTLRRWRVTGMAILMVLLVCALIPTRTNAWVWAVNDNVVSPNAYLQGGGLGIPTICLWAANGSPNLDAPWAFAILIISYVWKMGQLFDSSRLHLKKWLRSGPEWLLERAAVRALKGKNDTSTNRPLGPRLRYRVIMIIYVPTIAFFEFGDSFVASLWMLTIGLVWGSVQIFTTRALAPPEVSAAESIWGFGQILPMLFLLQPGVALFEHFYASHNASRQQKISTSFAKPVLLKIRSNLGLDKDKSSVTAVSASRSTTTTDLEPGAPLSEPPKKMSDFLKDLEPKPPSQKAELMEMEPHIEFMYSSRFFVALIWLINLFVFCCALAVFLGSITLIGFTKQVWTVSLIAITCSATCITMISSCASFFSKLYR